MDPGRAFDELLAYSKVPLLVLGLYNLWCGKCRQLNPLLERLCHEYAGRAYFVKVDVTKSQKFPERYEVIALPLLIFFANGKETGRLVGTIKEDAIRARLHAAITTGTAS